MFEIFSSFASSIFGGLQKKKQTEAYNEALRLQFETNVAITEESLSVLDYRTSVAETEAIRDRVRQNIATKKAVKEATGEAVVKAAQIGAAGRRVELGFKEAEKQGANLISDANVNAQIALTNITNQFNDTAKRMIDNLNMARPTYQDVPSTTEILLGAGMNAFSTYAQMDDTGRAGINESFSNLFKSKSNLHWGGHTTSGFGTTTTTPSGVQLGV